MWTIVCHAVLVSSLYIHIADTECTQIEQKISIFRCNERKKKVVEFSSLREQNIMISRTVHEQSSTKCNINLFFLPSKNDNYITQFLQEYQIYKLTQISALQFRNQKKIPSGLQKLKISRQTTRSLLLTIEIMADYDGLDKVFTVNGFCKYGRIQIGQIEQKTSAKSICQKLTQYIDNECFYLFGTLEQFCDFIKDQTFINYVSPYTMDGFTRFCYINCVCIDCRCFSKQEIFLKMLIPLFFFACEVTFFPVFWNNEIH